MYDENIYENMKDTERHHETQGSNSVETEVFRSECREVGPEFVLPVNAELQVKANDSRLPNGGDVAENSESAK